MDVERRKRGIPPTVGTEQEGHRWRVGNTYLLGTQVHLGTKQELRMKSQRRRKGEDLDMQAEKFHMIHYRKGVLRCSSPSLSDAASSSHLATLRAMIKVDYFWQQ